MSDVTGVASGVQTRRRVLSPSGLPGRIVLAIMATAGILYANIGPVIVSGLASSAQFTSETAGYVLSINMYGSTAGGLLIIFLVERLSWRPAAAALLTLLLLADVLSVWAGGGSFALSSARFMHGFAGGALSGLVLSVIARTQNPERTFAINIAIQITLGGLGTALLTPLIFSMGIGVVWLSMAGFTTLALAVLPLLDDVPVRPRTVATDVTKGRGPLAAIALAMAALFFYQAGEMSAFAYMIEVGGHHRLDTEFISLAVATSLWLSGPTGLLAAWWSLRSGRLTPACGGIVLTAGALALLFVAGPWAYFAANLGFGVMFCLTLPYLQGVASEMDNTGRLAAGAGFVSNFGLATGPGVAAFLLSGGSIDRVVLFAVFAVMLSAALVVYPARILDRHNRHGRVTW